MREGISALWMARTLMYVSPDLPAPLVAWLKTKEGPRPNRLTPQQHRKEQTQLEAVVPSKAYQVEWASVTSVPSYSFLRLSHIASQRQKDLCDVFVTAPCGAA